MRNSALKYRKKDTLPRKETRQLHIFEQLKTNTQNVLVILIHP